MSHRLQVLIPEELDARVGKAAQRARVSKGEWVRRALEASLRDDLAKRGKPTDPLQRLESLAGPTADIEEMLEQIDAGRR
jgi:hypothetical protein